jgi:hypothetical protein
MIGILLKDTAIYALLIINVLSIANYEVKVIQRD